MVAPADPAGLNPPAGAPATGVAVLVVNYNAGDALARCVESVLSQRLSLQVVVVDNASRDGSAERLRDLYGRRGDVHLLCND